MFKLFGCKFKNKKLKDKTNQKKMSYAPQCLTTRLIENYRRALVFRMHLR